MKIKHYLSNFIMTGFSKKWDFKIIHVIQPTTEYIK